MSIFGPISYRLASHVASRRYDELPMSTVEATKRAILDGIGVMLAASGVSVEVEPFMQLARTLSDGRTATILGTGERTSILMAAFCNGAMAHALDYEDAFDRVPLHPNASLLPAALALCEYRPEISGQDLIAAVAVGCDLVCRLGLAAQQPLEVLGWYPPPILGAYGAVSAGSRLLGLNPTQVIDAYSLLSCQNVCPGEIKHSARTHIRAIREAFPAQAAVLSCLLAKNGTPGFEQPIEGPNGLYGVFAAGQFDPEVLTEGLGERYFIETLSFKKWPCCRGTHAFIEAALELRLAGSIRADDVAEVVAIGDSIHRMLYEPFERKCRPETQIDAKFSLPFTVAAAICHGKVSLETFAPALLEDPKIHELASRVRFIERTPEEGSGAASGTLRLRLNDGREPECRIEHATGDPRRPLSDAELLEKFRACSALARRPMSDPGSRELAERLMALEHEASVAALMKAH